MYVYSDIYTANITEYYNLNFQSQTNLGKM